MNVLKFKTLKPIWLSWLDKDKEPEGWTAVKPTADNGEIDANTFWVIDHSHKDCQVFTNGSEYADFIEKDFEDLIKQDAIEILRGED